MVVTIHDVVTLLLPEYRERWINRLYTSIVALAARKAAAIIAVSETTKRDVSRVLGIAPDRIRVIGNAVDAQFRPVEDRQCLDALRARYGLPPQFILYLGGFDVRKNLARLLEAYARMSPALRAAYPLVIAGRAFLLGHPLYPDPHSAVERLGLDDAVRFVGEIAQEDTPALYSAATLLAWPSLYEGFGLPVLEAMACGTPVVTSSTSSLPEVAGDAARLVDPRDVDAMATAITTLLEDSDARAQLVERGLRRAAEFTWDRVAATTVDVYHSVLSRTS
jgi:glycosyltransferase involved in cell wall biosynthesis